MRELIIKLTIIIFLILFCITIDKDILFFYLNKQKDKNIRCIEQIVRKAL